MTRGWAVGWTWLWLTLVVSGLLTIGYVVVRLVRDGRYTVPDRHDRGTTPAHRILDERYARGEIDDDEYQRRRAVL